MLDVLSVIKLPVINPIIVKIINIKFIIAKVLMFTLFILPNKQEIFLFIVFFKLLIIFIYFKIFIVTLEIYLKIFIK